MPFRSDLATEVVEGAGRRRWTERDLVQKKVKTGGLTLTTTHIRSEQAATALAKPIGTYITADLPPLSDNGGDMEQIACSLAPHLTGLLPIKGPVLVVGLGNERITPDALGPMAAGMVLATRHIKGEFARTAGLCDLRPTAVLRPGVLGQTGVESSEIIRSVCHTVQPKAVIVIDALACRSLSRLGCTLQIGNTGIAPGSGVGNHRHPLNADTLGVPVIAMGVPTVVDAATVAMEVGGHAATGELSAAAGMMVTPREIDLIIDRAARLIAMTIHRLLHPGYSPLELLSLAV